MISLISLDALNLRASKSRARLKDVMLPCYLVLAIVLVPVDNIHRRYVRQDDMLLKGFKSF